MEQYLNYEGLSLYDSLLKQFISSNNIELEKLNLTDDNIFEIYFKKGGDSKKLSLNLSSLITEWDTL